MVVVVSSSPVWVHHKDLALGMAHGDAVGMRAGTARYGCDAADTLWVENAGGERLHAAHTCADTCVELFDSETVEESELCADHVLHGEDWKTGGVVSVIARVDAAWSCGAVTTSKDVRAYHEVFVCVEGAIWAYKFLPPAWFGVCCRRMCMRGG